MQFLLILTIATAILHVWSISRPTNMGGGNTLKTKQLKLHLLSKDWTTMMKSVCAILIVLHHIAKLPSEWYDKQDNFMVCLHQLVPISSIIVGIFFFISGYGLMYSVFNKKKYLDTFLKVRFPKILLPYIVIVVAGIVLFKFTDSSFSFIEDTKIQWNFGLSKVWGWFIAIFLLFYLIFYFCFKHFSHRNAAILVTFSVLLVNIVIKIKG